MIYDVQMLANHPDGLADEDKRDDLPNWENPRKVEVPDNEVHQNPMQTLERIFYWGQNDFQPRNCCSVSMGDVAELNGKRYICKSMGWEEISDEELAEYKKLPQRDRTFSKFVRDQV